MCRSVAYYFASRTRDVRGKNSAFHSGEGMATEVGMMFIHR